MSCVESLQTTSLRSALEKNRKRQLLLQLMILQEEARRRASEGSGGRRAAGEEEDDLRRLLFYQLTLPAEGPVLAFCFYQLPSPQKFPIRSLRARSMLLFAIFARPSRDTRSCLGALRAECG
jgi:hypothetical protein